ncbi:MAG TPA: hypothetical protein VN455_07490 [Methanotrichaceae archaeon]|nr:hypothetical protein [Methanotrichaceae archaeon]
MGAEIFDEVYDRYLQSVLEGLEPLPFSAWASLMIELESIQLKKKLLEEMESDILIQLGAPTNGLGKVSTRSKSVNGILELSNYEAVKTVPYTVSTCPD